MAEFDFILAPQDQLQFISFLLETGAVLVPYLAYPSPQYVTITDPVSAQALIQKGDMYGPIFVSWHEYTTFSYTYHEIEKEGAPRYFLRQREGGPYMDFSTCRMLEYEGADLITSGSVAYYRTYWVEEKGRELCVCDALKKRYEAVTAYLRSNCRRLVAGTNRAYWVGIATQVLLRQGTKAAVQGLEVPPSEIQ